MEKVNSFYALEQRNNELNYYAFFLRFSMFFLVDNLINFVFDFVAGFHGIISLLLGIFLT